MLFYVENEHMYFVVHGSLIHTFSRVFVELVIALFSYSIMSLPHVGKEPPNIHLVVICHLCLWDESL